jgi:AraC family transcriptional regulator
MVKEASADVAASDGMNAIRPVMAARWMSLSEWTPSDAEIGVLIPCEHAALTAVHRVDGTRERRAFVRAPMVALIPPGEPCRVFSQRPGETLVLMIASSFFARHARVAMGETSVPRLAAHYAALDPFLREIGNALCDDLRSGRPPNDAYLLPLAGVIAMHLVRHYCGALPGATLGGGLPQHKLKRVQEYVDEHLAEPLHVDQLAAEANISAFHFARMFKRATGQSPHLYVVMRRVECAKALLRDGDMPLIVVAQQAGFRTQGHFTGVFRRYTGCTPRLYRLSCRDEQSAATPSKPAPQPRRVFQDAVAPQG